MNLTETPDFKTLRENHYVFMEKPGPIPKNAPLAWEEFHRLRPDIGAENTITSFLSLCKVEPPTYRAGAALAAEPDHLPDNLEYECFPGGQYVCFVLIGPYSCLPKATRRVFEIVSEKKIGLRDGYHIENYVSDPGNTSEDKLITEILVPMA
jgi:DNA gyrase inhibitor GyrI